MIRYRTMFRLLILSTWTPPVGVTRKTAFNDDGDIEIILDHDIFTEVMPIAARVSIVLRYRDIMSALDILAGGMLATANSSAYREYVRSTTVWETMEQGLTKVQGGVSS